MNNIELYNGDCIEIMQSLIEQNIKVDAVITDPPYNISRETNFHTLKGGNRQGMDFGEWDKDFDIIGYISTMSKLLKENANVVIFNCWENFKDIKKVCEENHIIIKRCLVLSKCLMGNTFLFIKSKNKNIVKRLSLKDIYRTNFKNNQVWNGKKWVDIYNIEKVNHSSYLSITLRNGTTIDASKNHKFIIDGKEILASDLKVGDILDSVKLECEENKYGISNISDELFWFIGHFIAEGSYSYNEVNKEAHTIQISTNKNKQFILDKIDKLCNQYGATYSVYDDANKNSNRRSINIYSKVLLGFLNEYVSGKLAYGKHFSPKCFNVGKDKLKQLIQGYLDGDGCYIKSFDRYAIAFTRKNYELARDLITISNILGYNISMKKRYSTLNNKKYPIWSGKIKYEYNNSNNSNIKSGHEIMLIEEKENNKNRSFYDLQLETSDHLFALSDGTLTHNSNPAPFNRDRMFVNDVEFALWGIYNSKNKPTGWTFNRKNPVEKCVMNATVQHSKFHPTMKDIKVINKLVDLLTNEGDTVLDCFMGSGTTGVACKQLGRKFIGIEIDKNYCEIAKNRIENEG